MADAIEAPASTTAEGPTQHTQNQDARPSNTFGYSREEQIEALRKLREPFPQAEIRFLPRVWCAACKSSRGQGCQKHSISKCGNCNQKMPNGGHIDLRYVGHAEATNRLLNVDPFWDWEPLSVDERGLPQVDGYRGMWIRLTVCGMTRMGYGHAGDKTGGDAVKEVIGDAIRNAGMRFGMALDLWTPSDLEIIESGEDPKTERADETRGPARGTTTAARPAPAAATKAPADPDKGVHLDRLMGQTRDCWNEPRPKAVAALEQIKGDATKHQAIDMQVQGPGGTWMPFRELLDGRIAELKQAADGRNTEGQAA